MTFRFVSIFYSFDIFAHAANDALLHYAYHKQLRMRQPLCHTRRVGFTCKEAQRVFDTGRQTYNRGVILKMMMLGGYLVMFFFLSV